MSLAAWQKPAAAATGLPIAPIRTDQSDPASVAGAFGAVRPQDLLPRIDAVDARV